jgi:hypothetical protein
MLPPDREGGRDMYAKILNPRMSLEISGSGSRDNHRSEAWDNLTDETNVWGFICKNEENTQLFPLYSNTEAYIGMPALY